MRRLHSPKIGPCVGPNPSCGPAQSPPRCTKGNSPPINSHVPITVLLYDGTLLCGFNVAIRGLTWTYTGIPLTKLIANIVATIFAYSTVLPPYNRQSEFHMYALCTMKAQYIITASWDVAAVENSRHWVQCTRLVGLRCSSPRQASTSAERKAELPITCSSCSSRRRGRTELRVWPAERAACSR